MRKQSPYNPQIVDPQAQANYQPAPAQQAQPQYQQPQQYAAASGQPTAQQAQAAYAQQQAQYQQQVRAYQEYQRQQQLLQQQAQQQAQQQQYYQQNPHAPYHEAHAQQAQQRPYQQPAYWQQPGRPDQASQLPQPRPEKQRQVYRQLQQRLLSRPQDDHSWRKAIIVLMAVFGLIGFSLGYFVQSRQSQPRSSSTPVVADNGTVNNGSGTIPGAEPDEEVTVSLDAIVRADMVRILSKIENFVADNNGRIPNPSSLEDINELNTKYLDDEMLSPITGDPYIFVETNPERGQIRLYTGVVCGNSPGERVAGSSRNFSIQTPLTDGTYFCIDNTTVTTTEG